MTILEPLLILELALLGIATGFLAGLLGIGGGMLMVPFITIILSAKGFPADYAVKMAVALPGRVLSVLFAIFVAFSATQMFLDRKPKASRTLPGRWGTFAVGGLIGVLSSLVGAGGAFISVPFMTWCNIKIHDAVGTSAALGFPIALAGTLGYIWAGQGVPQMPPGSVGYLYLPGLVVISLASVSTAPWGARTAHRMDIRPLRKVFAIMLYALAAYFLLR